MIESSYDNTKTPYTLCPNCEAHWYHDDIDADTTDIKDNEDNYDMFCQNCGTFFDSDYPGKLDLTESEVESMFREGFSDCKWDSMTPTDKRCLYVDYTDYLCKDSIISTLMYNNMSGHSEG